ncbi:MAG: hypothetical protein PHW60_14640 [Kiritimatiellae bacterium]|nr:hypothetical protein [Kiritimatiellia bacterium]
MATALTFLELCRDCGKSQVYVRNLLTNLGLPAPARDSRYSSAYARFIRIIIALRTFSVPQGEISDLFTKEQIVLRLLKVDAFCASSTWYLDQCGNNGHKERRLMLTGYDVGFTIDGKVIQPNLDFGDRNQELFSGKEMGEDVRRALDSYLQLLAKIMARVDQERQVLDRAIQWAKETLG